MNSHYTPVHQFEIRFTPIINLSLKIKDLLAPYIQRTTNFNIENENLASQRITLNFDDNSYSIFITWDRIVLSSNIGIDDLSDPNSFVKEPFFAIYEKIQELSPLAACKNFLFYAIGVKEVEKSSFDDNFKFVKDKYLNGQSCDILTPGFNDCGVSLEKKSQNVTTTFTFGPYKGIIDFTNRNIQLTTKNISFVSDKQGMFAEYKSLNEQGITPDFKVYKNLISEFNDFVNRI